MYWYFRCGWPLEQSRRNGCHYFEMKESDSSGRIELRWKRCVPATAAGAGRQHSPPHCHAFHINRHVAVRRDERLSHLNCLPQLDTSGSCQMQELPVLVRSGYPLSPSAVAGDLWLHPVEPNWL